VSVACVVSAPVAPAPGLVLPLYIARIYAGSSASCSHLRSHLGHEPSRETIWRAWKQAYFQGYS
jgi:hypothetical protein